jgi:tetratricopeptide (TPR) repeat protein
MFGGLLPLRVLWPLIRFLWIALGLVVLGAVAFEYLGDLFGGNLPGANEAFATNPILQAPTRFPVWSLAGVAGLLVLTVVVWGATHEYQRLRVSKARRVYAGVRAGVRVEQLDEAACAAVAGGASSETFLLATQMHEQDRYADAIALYHLLLKKDPKDFGANFNLGLVFAELQQAERAEEYCRAAILLNAESAEAQGLLAYVLYLLGALQEAQRRARLAVRLGFPARMLEELIKPGLGETSSLPAVSAKEPGK